MKKIRIGATFTREYRFWNPLEEGDEGYDPDHPQPNYNSPRNITETVSFGLRTSANQTYLWGGAACIVLNNVVTVLLTDEQTSVIQIRSGGNASYLEFLSGAGAKRIKAARAEIIVQKWDIG